MTEVNDWVPAVNYTKSIEKKRLVYNLKGWFVFNYILTTSVVFISMAMLFLITIQALGDDNYIIVFIMVPISAFFIISFLYLNSFIIIDGKDIFSNKENMIYVLCDLYPEVTFEASEENILRDVRLTGFLRSGWCITVLFKDNVVYINKATLGRGNMILPFSGLFNYLRCKRIAEYFKSLQTNPTENISFPTAGACESVLFRHSFNTLPQTHRLHLHCQN